MHVPDFVVNDPEQAPVWEISGQGFTGEGFSCAACGHISNAQLTNRTQLDSKAHTTLSIRFPRVTRVRDDKDFSNHTDVPHLKALAMASAEG